MGQTFAQRQRKRQTTRQRAEEYAAYEEAAQTAIEDAHKASKRSRSVLADVQRWLDRV